jgi:Ca2+-binding RTX toxin-like protein
MSSFFSKGLGASDLDHAGLGPDGIGLDNAGPTSEAPEPTRTVAPQGLDVAPVRVASSSVAPPAAIANTLPVKETPGAAEVILGSLMQSAPQAGAADAASFSMQGLNLRNLGNAAGFNEWHEARIDLAALGGQYGGNRVRVGIYDDGIDKTHADLRDNYDASLELVIGGIRLDPNSGSGVHGTAVAGLIAAQDGNGIGGSGIASDARIAGVAVLGGNATGANLLPAMRAQTNFDVTNHSWGWVAQYADAAHNSWSFGAAFVAALDHAAANGRGGLGTIQVNAAGNSWTDDGRSAQASMFSVSRHTITVGAVTETGDVSFYSNRGASLLVAAPSNGGSLALQTTDRTGASGYTSGDYTFFGGTSGAAPIVSGVVALMLEANAGLGWRDVQDIIAMSADHVTPTALNGPAVGRMSEAWIINRADNVNGGGMHYSNDVGFGQIDAHEAVRLAEVWTRLHGPADTSANEQRATATATPNAAIRDGMVTTFSLSVGTNLELDSAQLTLTLTHPNVNDLRIELVSAEGTTTVVMTPMRGVQNGSGGFTWTYAAESVRGEMSAGTWTVRITDTRADGSLGNVSSARLDLYGDAASVNDVMHITDEFEKMAALQANRRTINDTDGGIDWISLVGRRDNMELNLGGGQQSRANGTLLFTLAAGALFENAVTGDGNDTIMGNAADNVLLGMRGNDRLDGAGGRDSLEGGDGNDVLIGGEGNDLLFGGRGNDSLAGGNGDDSLTYDGGMDTMDGGAGIDTLAFGQMSRGVIVDLVTGTVTADQTSTIIGIENVSGTQFADVITAGAAAGTIWGGAGADTIVSGIGAQQIWGGLDVDTVDYSRSNAGVTVTLGNGAAGIGGTAQGDRLFEVEALVGSTFNDILSIDASMTFSGRLDGGGGNDTLQGGGGADILIGGLGNDVLRGGNGSDTLRGGAGNDTLTGGTGADIFDFTITGRGGFDTITDFLRNDGDRIDLRGTGLSFAALTFSNVAGNLQVGMGAGGTVVVNGFGATGLTQQDFMFG